MSGTKSEFWWASIHGADPEPVEKTKRNGRDCILTCGCADPFYLDEPGVLLVGNGAFLRPEHPNKIAAQRAAVQANKRSYSWKGKTYKLPAYHGWRGPR